tara:strand:+ start:473 stop:643 length:171 start_codon:yes stop_codon:yes gene_type:complete
MRKIEYKTLRQIRAEIIKKVLDDDTIAVCITRCYETLFGATVPREADKDGKFEIRS